MEKEKNRSRSPGGRSPMKRRGSYMRNRERRETEDERLVNGVESNKILLLYTGGTIGMKETDDGLRPCKGFLEDYLKNNPEFQYVILSLLFFVYIKIIFNYMHI